MKKVPEMTTDHSAHGPIDALLASISALRAQIMRQVADDGVVWVAEADLPEFWMAVFNDRRPGSPRQYLHDGAPMISAAALHGILRDIDMLVALHAVGLDIDRPPEPDIDIPILDDWTPVVLSGNPDELALMGTVIGHPRLRDGRTIVTSNLAALHPDRKLARTMSRWYRLRDKSNFAKLRGRPAVAVRPGIRQASDREVRQMMMELRYKVTEATGYLVRARLIETEN